MPPDACSELDLEAAQQLAAEVERLREDIEAMLLPAARYVLDVPDDLRERLSLGARGSGYPAPTSRYERTRFTSASRATALGRLSGRSCSR